MKRDVQPMDYFQEAMDIYRAARRPGEGLITDAAELSTDGRCVSFAGTLVDRLEGIFATRICLTDLSSGDTRVVTFGPHTDRLPKFSPRGGLIAFLSDRSKPGDFQLYLFDLSTGGVRAAGRVEGWVEYLYSSPDGRQILLGVAGHGSDVSGAQGSVTSAPERSNEPSWQPDVVAGTEDCHWRRAWLYDVATSTLRRLGPEALNIWDATWCGTSSIAVVDAICSDRGIVAGAVQLIDVASGAVVRVNTAGVDIAFTEWRSERHLLLAGHRGFETVVGCYDIIAGTFTESWRSHELTTSGFYLTVAGFGEPGDCVLVGEGFHRAPELAMIRCGRYRTLRSFDQGYAEASVVIDSVEQVTWNAPDGIEI